MIRRVFDVPANYAAMLFALSLLLVGTRIGHVVPNIPPDASWGVFIVAGYYLRDLRAFVCLFSLAALVDFSLIGLGLVSGACVNWGYLALVFAYGALFFGGYCATSEALSWKHYARSLMLWLCAVSAAFAISNLGFYLGSPTEHGLLTFIEKVLPYYGTFVQTSAIYAILIVACTDGALLLTQKSRKSRLSVR